jgi:predicted dehydrogenase
MKLVVVGFGFMGMTHTINILKNPNLRLAAIVDKNENVVREKVGENPGNFTTGSLSAEELAKIKVYTNLVECLDTEKPDACVIAVHTALHYEMTKLALEKGVHVFLEKPFCLNIEEGEKLISLAKSQNKLLMIGHVVRFMPAYEKLKEIVDSQEFGKLEFLSLHRFSGLPSWGQWKEKQQDFGSSGGALFDLVIHDIDFAQWLCGVPNKIDASCLPGKLSNHDYVSAMWSYNHSDLKVKVEGGNTFHSAYPFQAGFSARFANASILFSSKESDNIVVATDTETKLIPVGDANDGFSGELYYFTDCVRKNEAPEKCTAESALEAIKICWLMVNG